MTAPHVLLISGGIPGGQGVAEIFLGDLCRHYPRGRLCRFAIQRENVDGLAQDWIGFPTAYGRSLREAGIGRLGRRCAQLTASPIHWYARNVRMPALARQAIRFARQHHAELVWAVLNKPALIYMARRVAAALGVPLVVTVWDPPERFAEGLQLGPCSCRALFRDFRDTLRTAVRCGVASEGMQSEYKARYGIESVVLIHGIHPRLMRPPAAELTEGDSFVIGLAGSIYAVQEWQALLSALSSIDWRIGEREVIVRVLSSGVHLRAQGKMHVEYLGWRSLEETLNIMSRCDITYVPYWFDESYSLAVRLSFPNKLATYLAAGRPVLYHGPEDSSPTRFFRRFPVGLCCHSLEESDIIESLSRFVTDRDFYASAARQTQVAVEQELNLRVLLRRFAALIGTSEAELLPLP